MNDFIVFIDTETSGLPHKWDLPYEVENNWPCAVQVSWIICSNDGTKVKQENHYIRDIACTIDDSAEKIHGLTLPFLEENGRPRDEVLGLLAEDLKQYKPLVVGHFVELDVHVLSADYQRSRIENPLVGLQQFCTMQVTQYLVFRSAKKYLRLGDLHQYLFNATLEGQHNAIVDAEATMRCFFELARRGEISDSQILRQQQPNRKYPVSRWAGWVALAMVLALISILIFF